MIGLTKNGLGTLQLSSGSGANANSYTGPTAVNQGTLKLTAANLTGNTALSLGNDPTATFDMNNLSVSISGLSGGGPAGGTFARGTANLTIGGTTNSSYGGTERTGHAES